LCHCGAFYITIYSQIPSQCGFPFYRQTLGKQVKLFDGHEKYKRHKRRELLATKRDQDAKINWWWREILKWLLLTALGFLLRFLTEPKQKLSKEQESQRTTSTTSISAKPNRKHANFIRHLFQANITRIPTYQ
jgi:hypothetical protein